MKFSITCWNPEIPTVLFINVDPSDKKLATKHLLNKDKDALLPIVADVLNFDNDPYIYVEFNSGRYRARLSQIKSCKLEDFIKQLDDYLYSFNV